MHTHRISNSAWEILVDHSAYLTARLLCDACWDAWWWSPHSQGPSPRSLSWSQTCSLHYSTERENKSVNITCTDLLGRLQHPTAGKPRKSRDTPFPGCYRLTHSWEPVRELQPPPDLSSPQPLCGQPCRCCHGKPIPAAGMSPLRLGRTPSCCLGGGFGTGGFPSAQAPPPPGLWGRGKASLGLAEPGAPSTRTPHSWGDPRGSAGGPGPEVNPRPRARGRDAPGARWAGQCPRGQPHVRGPRRSPPPARARARTHTQSRRCRALLLPPSLPRRSPARRRAPPGPAAAACTGRPRPPPRGAQRRPPPPRPAAAAACSAAAMSARAVRRAARQRLGRGPRRRTAAEGRDGDGDRPGAGGVRGRPAPAAARRCRLSGGRAARAPSPPGPQRGSGEGPQTAVAAAVETRARLCPAPGAEVTSRVWALINPQHQKKKNKTKQT